MYFFRTLIISAVMAILSGVMFSTYALSQSTPEDRAALFEYILTKTFEREAFSPVKNRNLDLNIRKEMLKYRDEMIAADTEEELFHVIVKISNARKDRHLSVSTVDDGLKVQKYGDDFAPVRFAVDYGNPGEYFLFLADFTENYRQYFRNITPEIGDRLIAVNGFNAEDYFILTEPYYRYSTVNGFWWKLAEGLPGKDYRIPAGYYGNELKCTFEQRNGTQYSVSLPYMEADKIRWKGYWKNHGDNKYPGFERLYRTQTFVLHKDEDGDKILLLDWYGFREDLVKDMDNLIEYAQKNDLLDYNIIVDATRSRGGSRGAYAIQRLSPRPFKTTFGNIRLSDIADDFIKDRNERFERRQILDSGVNETIDDGSWLIDWLNDDVTKGLQAGQEYSNNVPFKLAHAPKHSDGILKPADVHFTGQLICFLGPNGGSHLDQFASIVVDNSLGFTVGMQCGGYSNTWEWEETLVFPISGEPVAEFMWSIGHTISPDGEILEGNPSKVDKYIPLTRDNYPNYYSILLENAFKYIEKK
ncbi:MAG: hypothetical protein GY863_07320 [bacterium]|nr:hypothetical protein [bacterium]